MRAELHKMQRICAGWVSYVLGIRGKPCPGNMKKLVMRHTRFALIGPSILGESYGNARLFLLVTKGDEVMLLFFPSIQRKYRISIFVIS